jgi:bacillithiol biosynthesis deacetylase BshB1
MIEPIDLLAFAAHPDDVELACAGTMLLAKRSGRRTGIVDLSQGELSTRGTLESRAVETAEATKILSLDYRTNLKMPDGNIERSQEYVHRLIREIRYARPTILLAPSRFERHPDHEAAADIVRRATFYSGLAKIETKDEDGTPQAPHRPLLVLHYMQTYTFKPSIIVDVSEVYEDRERAMMAYGSQFQNAKARDKADPETFLSQAGFFDWLRSRAGAYGMMIGVQYGEPFWSAEPIGTRDLFSAVTKKLA